MACSCGKSRTTTTRVAGTNTPAPIITVLVDGSAQFRTRDPQEAERKKAHYERLGLTNVTINPAL